MKAQIRMIIASVIVIALALTAVSGITYSWFSDTEQSDITITTAKVDYTVGWKASGSNDVGTSWTVNDGVVTITGLAANAAIPVIESITNDSTIKTVYKISATAKLASGHNYTLYDLKNIYIGGKQLNASSDGSTITLGETVIVDWTLLEKDSNPAMQTVSITTPESYGGVDASHKIVAYNPTTGEGSTTKDDTTYTADWSQAVERKGLTITLSVVAAQGDYPTDTLDGSGTATIPVNGVVKGTVTNTSETTAKTMEVTANFSSVTNYGADGADPDTAVTGTKIKVETEATGTTEGTTTIGSVASVKLTLQKDNGDDIPSPNFDNPVVITAVIDSVTSDPGVVEVQYNGSTDGIETISSVYNATAQTLTVTFSTTHFSQFNVISAGISAEALIGGTYYETIDAAFEAYSDSDYAAGRALVLMTDIKPPAQYKFNKDIIIDLNENTFYFTNSSNGGYLTKITGNFTLMNGNVVRETNAGFGHFTIENNEKKVNVTFKNIIYTNNYPHSTTGSSSNALKDAIKVNANTANDINLTIEDCTFTEGKIYLCGLNDAKTITTSISGCTFVSNETNTCFIYVDSYGNTSHQITVSDCTFNAGVTSGAKIIDQRHWDSDGYGKINLTFKDCTVTADKSTVDGAKLSSWLSMTVVGGTNITVNGEKITDNQEKRIEFT